jgi:hypothetical protein
MSITIISQSMFKEIIRLNYKNKTINVTAFHGEKKFEFVANDGSIYIYIYIYIHMVFTEI